MKLRKKLVSTLIVTMLMLTGCGQGNSASNAKVGATTVEDTLIYANFRDLRDLNPHIYSGELFAQNLLFESLVKVLMMVALSHGLQKARRFQKMDQNMLIIKE